jgi:general secretion pathway protein A
LIPARPPIRFEEGLVEVGWEGDLEAEPTRPEASPADPEPGTTGEDAPGEELVEDRYAALQAWAEWSRNRERSVPAASDSAVDADSTSPEPAGEPAEAVAPRGDVGPLPSPSIRAETPHDFAPYGQLFSRLRHSL